MDMYTACFQDIRRSVSTLKKFGSSIEPHFGHLKAVRVATTGNSLSEKVTTPRNLAGRKSRRQQRLTGGKQRAVQFFQISMKQSFGRELVRHVEE